MISPSLFGWNYEETLMLAYILFWTKGILPLASISFLFRFCLILIWFIRSGCYLGDFWDLRYYPQQYITFELYSSEAFNARADLRFYTDSIPFMDNWHRITLFVLSFIYSCFSYVCSFFFCFCFSYVLPLFYFCITFGLLFCLFLMWQRYCDYPTWVQHSHARERDAAWCTNCIHEPQYT